MMMMMMVVVVVVVLLPGLGVRTDQEEVPAATVWKVYEREEGGGRRVVLLVTSPPFYLTATSTSTLSYSHLYHSPLSRPSDDH